MTLRIAIIDFGGFLWFFRALCLNSIAVVLAFLANNEIYIWAIAGYLGLFFASSIRKFFVVITRSHVFEAATSIIYWYIILIADILVIICLFGGIHRLLGVRLADGMISHEVADALLLSVSAWTTLVFGDVAPNGLGRFIVGIEALMGVYAMSLLVAGTVMVMERLGKVSRNDKESQGVKSE